MSAWWHYVIMRQPRSRRADAAHRPSHDELYNQLATPSMSAGKYIGRAEEAHRYYWCTRPANNFMPHHFVMIHFIDWRHRQCLLFIALYVGLALDSSYFEIWRNASSLDKSFYRNTASISILMMFRRNFRIAIPRRPSGIVDILSSHLFISSSSRVVPRFTIIMKLNSWFAFTSCARFKLVARHFDMTRGRAAIGHLNCLPSRARLIAQRFHNVSRFHAVPLPDGYAVGHYFLVMLVSIPAVKGVLRGRA